MFLEPRSCSAPPKEKTTSESHEESKCSPLSACEWCYDPADPHNDTASTVDLQHDQNLAHSESMDADQSGNGTDHNSNPAVQQTNGSPQPAKKWTDLFKKYVREDKSVDRTVAPPTSRVKPRTSTPKRVTTPPPNMVVVPSPCPAPRDPNGNINSVKPTPAANAMTVDLTGAVPATNPFDLPLDVSATTTPPTGKFMLHDPPRNKTNIQMDPIHRRRRPAEAQTGAAAETTHGQQDKTTPTGRPKRLDTLC